MKSHFHSPDANDLLQELGREFLCLLILIGHGRRGPGRQPFRTGDLAPVIGDSRFITVLIVCHRNHLFCSVS